MAHSKADQCKQTCCPSEEGWPESGMKPPSLQITLIQKRSDKNVEQASKLCRVVDSAIDAFSSPEELKLLGHGTY